MYSFVVTKAEEGKWWIMAVKWGTDPQLIGSDEGLAQMIGMTTEKMRTEIVRYYGAELYPRGGTYWETEFEAKKCVDVFFKPRLMAMHLINSGEAV